MCYRTKLNTTLSKIEKTFGATFIEPELFAPQEEINAFTFEKTPVITNENRGDIQMFNWGLIPFWAKDDRIKKMTLNAKIETVKIKPAFRNSVENRCLIIANGYYEWQWLDTKGKQKQKYMLELEDKSIFAFAGIYSSWDNLENGERVNSYSILTTEANELMSKIHTIKKRMPVILKHQDHSNYLEGAEVSNFAFPYDVLLKFSAI